MKIKSLITVLSIIFFISINGCEKKESQDKVQINQTKSKTKNNSLTLTTIDNQNIQLTTFENQVIFDNFKNKIVLINFFATWCPPCKYEIPHLVNLQKKYKNNLQIIGILLEDGKSSDELKEFVQEFSINYPITNDNKNFYFADLFGGIHTIPTSFIFDKNGKYVTHYNGAAPEEMIDFDIQKVLKKQ